MSVRRFGDWVPRLGERVFVDPQAVVIGDVELGDDCSVWPGAVIRGDMQRIRIGQRCSLQDGCVLHITHAGPYDPEGKPLQMGDDVTVGHRAILHGCTLGSRILVGMGAIVMDGAVLGDDLILGAGTLVLAGQQLPGGHLYVGSPARQLRPLQPGELAYLTYTAANYVALKERCRAEGWTR